MSSLGGRWGLRSLAYERTKEGRGNLRAKDSRGLSKAMNRSSAVVFEL